MGLGQEIHKKRFQIVTIVLSRHLPPLGTVIQKPQIKEYKILYALKNSWFATFDNAGNHCYQMEFFLANSEYILHITQSPTIGEVAWLLKWILPLSEILCGVKSVPLHQPRFHLPLQGSYLCACKAKIKCQIHGDKHWFKNAGKQKGFLIK